jgi:hypothetical protein
MVLSRRSSYLQWAFPLCVGWLGAVPLSATHNEGSFGGISLLHALVERTFLVVFAGTFSTMTSQLIVHTVGPITGRAYVSVPAAGMTRPEPRHFPNLDEWNAFRRAYSDVDLSRVDDLDLYVSGAY